jgi:nitrate/TMAO reductase-like tetraheme cytochrome c subunit
MARARNPDRRRRWLRIAVQAFIGLVLLAGVSAVGFVNYAAQPSFCTNCHNMQPYYDSWTTSTHHDVPCIKCHYAPGIKAEAMGKVQAANQVVKYVTGTYGTKPWAEIEDAACLRSGCHSTRKLEGELTFLGVRFDHRHHLTRLRRGKQLRCTSCHSQIVQGDHVAVTKSTCFLCHFRGRPEGEPLAGCTGCHAEPPRVATATGVIDHPQYVRDMVSCISCHDRVTAGDGAAEQDRCFACHNESERIALFDDPTLVHEVHLSEHNVECQLCHRPIAHEMVSHAERSELDCVSCHQGTHEAQRSLYMGTGGHGTDDDPSTMYVAQVSCGSCHGLPREISGHEQVQAAGEATCLACHGTRYSNILPSWQAEMDGKLDQVSSIVRAASAAPRTGSAAERSTTDSLLALAVENVQLVSVGQSAHNIGYADALLRAALEYVDRASRSGGIDYRPPAVNLGTAVAENACLGCHLGVDQQQGVWQGARFSHQPHLKEANLPCSACHTGPEEHGGVILGSPAACSDCHHSGAIACERCHAGGARAPAGTVSTSIGEFPHPAHVALGFPCATCHGETPGTPSSGLCLNCHDAHHQPEATCLSCHREGVLQIHPIVAHQGCAVCHGEAIEGVNAWSRNVCTVCHADRVDHNAPVACEMCHEVPPLGQ